MVRPILGHPAQLDTTTNLTTAGHSYRVVANCSTSGHSYGGPGGWRACACSRSMPAHADTPPDPAGGPGCGMVWRGCPCCAHIAEHHITDHDSDAELDNDGGLHGGLEGGGGTRPPWWPEVVTVCG